MADIHPPRGMRDFLPADKAARESVLATIRRSYARFGYQEIETPVVEELSRLASSDGGENLKLIYRILKRRIESGDVRFEGEHLDTLSVADLGLRFDLTVPLARFYASNRGQLPEVFRSIQIGSVYRAERPQKGRFRQFTQCDLDVIGEPGVLAEMELITATLSTLDELGIQGCTVRVNDRRRLLAMLENSGFEAAAHGRVLITIDKLDKIGLDGVEAELVKHGYASEAISGLMQRLANPSGVTDGPGEDLDAIASAVQSVVGADRIRQDATLVRGMGYYTGPIFEIEHPESSSSIAGGGRYDGMIGRFLGQDVPACGFSIGFERIVDMVTGAADDSESKLALLYSADADPASVVRWQSELIASGRQVRLVRAAKKMGKQLDVLAAEGFAEFVSVRADTAAVTAEDIRTLGA